MFEHHLERNNIGWVMPAGEARRTGDGFTYLVLAKESSRIKIGFSSSLPHNRLDNLRTGSPEPLSMLGFFIGNFESSLHLKFRSFRRHREWFEAAAVLSWLCRVGVADIPASVLEPPSSAPRLHPIPKGRMFTSREAADYLGCSTWTLRQWFYRGLIPAFRLTRSWRFDIRDLDAFITRTKEKLP